MPGTPLLFEAIPPPVHWSTAAPLLERLAPLRHLPLAGILVPEILDGEYATADPQSFALELGRQASAPPLVNLVVAHQQGDAIRQWGAQARERGIEGVVVVGSTSSKAPRTGVSVEGSLNALQGTRRLGVVTIPGRERAGLSEAERLARKVRAGATFAVSQVALDLRATAPFLSDLAKECQRQDLAPPIVHWTLAPFESQRDLALLTHLGVAVPPRLQGLVGGRRTGGAASHAHNLATAEGLLIAAEAAGISVGFCVSHLTLRNIPAALELADLVAALTRSTRQPTNAAPLHAA